MSKYETVYPNTVKYEPQIKSVVIELYGKNYKVNNGVRNLMRVNKMVKKIEEDPETVFEIVDKLFYKGFCDEIEAIETNFPFDDFLGFVMDEINSKAPDALQDNGYEDAEIDITAEPKKE